MQIRENTPHFTDKETEVRRSCLTYMKIPNHQEEGCLNLSPRYFSQLGSSVEDKSVELAGETEWISMQCL